MGGNSAPGPPSTRNAFPPIAAAVYYAASRRLAFLKEHPGNSGQGLRMPCLPLQDHSAQGQVS
jgi:hypothetical protein